MRLVPCAKHETRACPHGHLGGLLAAIVVLLPVSRVLPDAQVWLVLICCLPAATLAGWMFERVARRLAAQYECKDCHNRWRDTAEPAGCRATPVERL